jgi:hypothetical protein
VYYNVARVDCGTSSAYQHDLPADLDFLRPISGHSTIAGPRATVTVNFALLSDGIDQRDSPYRQHSNPGPSRCGRRVVEASVESLIALNPRPRRRGRFREAKNPR